MAATVPTTEPVEARAGDTWQWRREDLSDYLAGDGWTLTYYFRNSAAKFSIAAAADGDLYAVSVAMATTAGYTVGDYDWTAFVESATERFQVASGRIEVLANFETDVVYDARSFARKMLDIIEAALLAEASADQLHVLETSLADRGMKFDRNKLPALRAQFRAEVQAEDNAARIKAGKTPRNRILAVG
jgi:hypothetical protein